MRRNIVAVRSAHAFLSSTRLVYVLEEFNLGVNYSEEDEERTVIDDDALAALDAARNAKADLIF